MNTRTAHSQYMGAMIWGNFLRANMKRTEIDQRRSRAYINDNFLRDYLIPVKRGHSGC